VFARNTPGGAFNRSPHEVHSVNRLDDDTGKMGQKKNVNHR
jgi:hypothetical protein